MTKASSLKLFSTHLYIFTNKNNDDWACRLIFCCRLIKQMKTYENMEKQHISIFVTLSPHKSLLCTSDICARSSTNCSWISLAHYALMPESCSDTHQSFPIQPPVTSLYPRCYKRYKIIEPCHKSWTLRYHLIGEVCILCFWMLLDLMWRRMSWS